MRTAWRRLDRPLGPALLALLLGSIVVAFQLSRDGDVSAFVRAAPPWTDPAAVPPGLRVVSAGYDGMFYYRLALDPFTTEVTAHGITFDRPAYRQQRILYPLAAWILSAGQEQRVPVTLVLVDLIGLSAIGWLGGALARDAGRHALWGLLFSTYPGFVITLTSDLTEIVAAVCVLAALWWLRRARSVAGAAMLALATLARETTILVAAAAGVAAFRASPRLVRAWLPFVAPAIVLAAWQATLVVRWHETAAGEGATSVTLPFLGVLAAAWFDPQRFSPTQLAVWAAIVAFVLATIFIGFRCLRNARPHERLAWYAYLALATILEANIWANGAVLRALTDLEMLTALLALGASLPWRRTLFALDLVLCLVLVGSGLRI